MCTQNHLKLALNCFKSEILNPLDDHTYLLLAFKIKTTDQIYSSISTLQRINKFDIEELEEVFNEFWELKNSSQLKIY